MVPVTREFVFQSGFVSSRARLAFVTNHVKATEDEIPNAQLFVFRNGRDWSQTVMEWSAVGLAGMLEPVPTVVVLGRDGETLTGDANGLRQGQIDDQGASPLKRGPMRNIRAIAESVFAVGMARQVYRRMGDNTWIRYEDGLPSEIPHLKVAGFNSIDGATLDDLYTVGWGGEIWHHDGTEWWQEESPTNLALFDVLVVSPSEVYGCGQAGTILRGSTGQWSLLEFEGPKPTFRSMAWFNGKLYLADGLALYSWVDGVLSVVDFGVGEVVPSAHLHANDGILLSVAGKEVFTTPDGAKWDSLPI
jgi:hypothetical protein